MQLSSSGLSLLKRSEGFVSTVYRDAAGLETIGYGHRLQTGEQFPSGITEEQAETILANDVSYAAKCVTTLCHVPLTQGQFDALVDFTFNLGPRRLAESTLLRDLNAKQYDAAALQLLQWDHIGLKESSALKARRTAEYQLWTGHAPNQPQSAQTAQTKG